MIPQKCIDRNCPRKGIDGKGTDVCILYQVSEKDKELAVLDVFNVSHRQCRQLRQQLAAAIKEDTDRFAQPKEVAITPLNKD